MEQTTLTPSPRVKLNPIGELLKVSWSFFISNFKPLILIALFMMSPSIISQILISIFGQQPPTAISLIETLLLILSIVTGVWGAVAMITFIKENKPKMTITEAFNKNVSLFWSYLWLSILVSLIVLGGLILLIIPGIIWAVYFSLVSYVLVCEGLKGYTAAKRSKELVKDYWWPVLGRLILIGLIIIAIFILISLIVIAVFLILGPIQQEIIYSFLVILISILITPLATLYSYNIYLNLKQIKTK